MVTRTNKRALSALTSGVIGAILMASTAQAETISVWWNKGFYPEQDEAVKDAVKAWEESTGNTVNLSFYGTGAISTKIVSAIEAGQVPDVAYADFNDFAIAPQQAWKGNLADVSSVVEPLEDQYTEAALTTAQLYDNEASKRSYYAVPMKLAGGYTFYWKSLVEEAGKSLDDVPDTWDAYWDFFGDIQATLREDGRRIYGLGLPVSAVGSDSGDLFHQAALHYGAYFVNEDGTLNLTDETRQGAIETLEFLKEKYEAGLVPPGAISWDDADNNAAFFSKQVVLVANPSLSIPASKADDQKVYDDIATHAYPKMNDGSAGSSLVSVKVAIVPKEAEHVDLAKEFLSFIVQPKRLNTMLQASRGRFLPVMPEMIKEGSIWTDESKSHIVTAIEQDVEGNARPWPYSFNPAYAQVNAEQVWGKAIGDVLNNGVDPGDAVDAAFAKIEDIFADYEIVGDGGDE